MQRTGRFFSCSKKRMLLYFGLAVLVMMPFMPNGSIAHAQTPAKNQFTISPTPQQLKVKGEGFPLDPVVGLVIGKNTDQTAIQEVVKVLKSHDVKQIVKRQADERPPQTPVTIWVGSPSSNPGSAKVLKTLNVEGPQDLKQEGYVLASGHNSQGKKTIVLAGKDPAGTFYAAQTFRQLIQDHPGLDWMPAVEVRDWPEMGLRGVIEGFYGPPWSHQDRMSQIAFYGRNKMNTYVYAPKDDPYHRDKWREPYPEKRINQLKELVQKARQNHVQFVFGLSPGKSICYSGDQDFELLMDKMQAMYDIGIRSYAIFLDDISRNLRCQQDRDKFGDDPSPAASAQAYLLNRFQQAFIDTHEGTHRLITVPTDYAGTANTVYQQQFAELVDPEVIVDWTGPAVVSHEITAEQAQRAHEIFKHDLLIWDNYPVNDFATNRLFLGPLVNRDPDLTEHGVMGITANPMIQAEASKIPLFTEADYMWNPQAYNPKTSWKRSIQAFGGDAADALKTFAENTYSSRLNDKEALKLKPLIEKFWQAYQTGEASQASANLLNYFKKMKQTPAQLRENLDNENFLKETKPWLDKLGFYGKAGQAAVKMLEAKLNGNQQKVNEYHTRLEDILANDDTTNIIIPETQRATRELDGVNQFRGAGELIQYTPEYGDYTRTNIWGYEITVVNGTVTKMGGNNSAIPDNGYVLSIHNSNWLKNNAIVGSKVEIKDGTVILTIPKGVYTVPNNKVMDPGVMDPFIQKAESEVD